MQRECVSGCLDACCQGRDAAATSACTNASPEWTQERARAQPMTGSVPQAIELLVHKADVNGVCGLPSSVREKAASLASVWATAIVLFSPSTISECEQAPEGNHADVQRECVSECLAACCLGRNAVAISACEKAPDWNHAESQREYVSAGLDAGSLGSVAVAISARETTSERYHAECVAVVQSEWGSVLDQLQTAVVTASPQVTKKPKRKPKKAKVPRCIASKPSATVSVPHPTAPQPSPPPVPSQTTAATSACEDASEWTVVGKRKPKKPSTCVTAGDAVATQATGTSVGHASFTRQQIRTAERSYEKYEKCRHEFDSYLLDFAKANGGKYVTDAQYAEFKAECKRRLVVFLKAEKEVDRLLGVLGL